MHIVKDLGYKDMMPRRLLAFPTELSDESSVKLVEITVTQKDQLQLYVALSHRWGGSEIFRTTTSNLDHAKEGMRLADIPRLYREAIQATARLGYEYLWIDALCIVQDDAEDWKQEAKRMAVIYGNSVVSITAMDTKDSGDEIFPTTVADADAESEDLNSRGWVLQEQMISPRSLICTRNGLSWECREADAHHGESELRSRERLQEKKDDKPSNMAIPNHQKELFAFFRDFRVPGVEFDEDQHEFMTVNSDLRGERESYEPLLRAWWKLVAAYSPRKLTFGKDKFLALNGIAGVVLRFTQLKNSFGLWYHFIEHELLWYVDPLGPRATKPREFRVPTWSWANVDGGVVRNSYYERLPAVPQLMVKPEFTMPVGTSFDQELPIPGLDPQVLLDHHVWRPTSGGDHCSPQIGRHAEVRRQPRSSRPLVRQGVSCFLFGFRRAVPRRSACEGTMSTHAAVRKGREAVPALHRRATGAHPAAPFARFEVT